MHGSLRRAHCASCRQGAPHPAPMGARGALAKRAGERFRLNLAVNVWWETDETYWRNALWKYGCTAVARRSSPRILGRLNARRAAADERQGGLIGASKPNQGGAGDKYRRK